MNGIIYCRVSSEEQVKGTSLESQEIACREFARAKGINTLKVFTEEGESAKFADRTQLIELLDYCCKNKLKPDVLIVWKLDRFARVTEDHYGLKAMLMKSGVKLLSATEPIDDSPEGKLMEAILAGQAQYDNDIRAKRTIAGMSQRIRNGISPWHPPLGYKKGIALGEKKYKPDEPDEPLFGLLQKAWKMYSTGGYTKREIGSVMTSWGAVTKRGKPLSPQHLDYFFSNPFYAGILIDPWSKEEFTGRHIPMVSQEIFARAQEIINKRSRAVPHNEIRPEFPLRGFVRCCGCVHYLTGSFSRGRSVRYPYYHCYQKICPMIGKTTRASAIHDEFKGFLDKVALQDDSASQLQTAVLEIAHERFSSSKAKKANREAELKQLDKQIHELITMRSRELINDEQFIHEKSLLNRKRLLLEENDASNTLNPKKIQDQLNGIMEPLSELKKTWTLLPQPHQSRFQRLILPAGFITGRIGTAETGFIFSVSGQFAEAKPSLVSPTFENWNRIVKEIHAFSEILKHLPGSKPL